MKVDKIGLISVVLIVAFFVGRKLYFKPDVIQGDKAPNFTATTLSSSEMQLQDLIGNYVLLDFWGSWCAPCREENPNLVALYEKFHGARFEDAENFEIVSVGIEKDRERWLKAIERDGLDWSYHVSDLKEFESEVAKRYGIRSIPSKFLINPKGVVIGVNQSAEEIEDVLEGKLKSTAELSRK
ncbi:MAG: TlpA disulfide reductase family protein [Bacteroidota bacterium]